MRAGSRGFIKPVLLWIFFLSSLFIPTKPVFQCIIQSLITCGFSVFFAYLGRSRADLSDIFSGKLQAKVSEVLVGSNLNFGISGLRNSGIQFRNSGKSGILAVFWLCFGCFWRISGVPGPIWVIFSQESCRLGCLKCWRGQIRNSGSVGSGIPEFKFRNCCFWLFLAVFGCFWLFLAVFGVSRALLGRSG